MNIENDEESLCVPDRTRVNIILATYNGALYLAEQLQSIVGQTFTDWHLFACDDGSTDATLDLLQNFAHQNPEQVTLLRLPPSGAAGSNFFRLLRLIPADSDYVAFSDQDDVWVPGKLATLVSRCQDVEERVGVTSPVLVYSDISVADAELRVTASSFAQEIGAKPERLTFGSALVENAIPGCSMIVNRGLLQLFRTYRGSLKDARMHDWWLVLLALAFGYVEFVPQQLMLYRQHSTNAAGSVKRRSIRLVIRKLANPGSNEWEANVRQATLLMAGYGDRLGDHELLQVTALSRFGAMKKSDRMATSIRLGLLKGSWPRRIYQMIKV